MSLFGIGQKEEYSSRSDEEILAASIEHPSAFEILVDKYQKSFLRRALKIVHNKEESEDVVQETFLKIYKNADKFQVREGALFKDWAYKILTNTSFTHYNKQKRTKDNTVGLTHEFHEKIADPSTENNFDDFALNDYTSRILNKLPKHLSQVLRLHFIEGFPQKDIADKEGVSVGAVKARVHRAKNEFRKISISTNN